MSAEREPLPPDIAELLRREREADGPSSEARARIHKRVLASLGSGVAVATIARSAATGKVAIAGGVASKLTVMIVACGLGTGAIAVGAYALAHHHAAAVPLVTPATAVSHPPATTQPVSAPPALAVQPSPPPPPVEATAPRTVAHHERERADLREERALLASAHDALAASDSKAAIAALDRHAHRFPSGQLAEERECLRIRALGEAGDAAGAERAATAFAQRYPHGLFQAATCASRDGTR